MSDFFEDSIEEKHRDYSRWLLWTVFAALTLCCVVLCIALVRREAPQGPTRAIAHQDVSAAAHKQPPPTAEETPPKAEHVKTAFEQYISNMIRDNGGRFEVPQGQGAKIMQQIINHVPKSEFVDLKSMYKTMEGLDGSTTQEALEIAQSLYIDKYYMLQGDVFQIQADRDYRREGMNKFAVFGRVRLIGNYPIPVNVFCISAQKIPPYQEAPILGKIMDFILSTNRRGDKVIIPVVKVIAVNSTSGCCGNPENVILNEE